MLKRRGNFPYDFDAAYPAYPTPVMPPNYVPIPLPPPAPPAAAPPSMDPPPPPPQPTPTAPAELKSGAPKSPPRKPRRRRRPLERHSLESIAGSVPPSDESDASRHARKCSICNHPERDSIDDDYIHWASPILLASQFNLTDRSVRRHANATGLQRIRREKICSVLDQIVENAGTATVTAGAVIRAIRAYSCINDSGQWVDPPKRVIHTVENPPQIAIPLPAPSPAPTPANANPVLESPQPLPTDPLLIVRPEIRNRRISLKAKLTSNF